MMAELLDDGAGVSGRSENVVADVIATSGGFSPVVHLSAHLGQKPVWDEQVLGFLPNPNCDLLSAGGTQGVYELADAMSQASQVVARPWA